MDLEERRREVGVGNVLGDVLGTLVGLEGGGDKGGVEDVERVEIGNVDNVVIGNVDNVDNVFSGSTEREDPTGSTGVDTGSADVDGFSEEIEDRIFERRSVACAFSSNSSGVSQSWCK